MRMTDKFQAEFATCLLQSSGLPPDGLLGRDRRQAASPTRFNIYRNNVISGLIGVMRARYPIIERLVGEDFFKASAHRFVTTQPPLSPVLLEYGEDFPDFLDAFEPARDLPYLGDVARLEWLRHAALHASDAEAMNAALLSAVPPESLGDIIFRPHPAARLLCSDYPAVSIWRTNTEDAEVRPISLTRGGEAALITRLRFEVVVTPLTVGEFSFFSKILDGAPLGLAVEAAISTDAAFDAGKALGDAFATGAFTSSALSAYTGQGERQ
jgi:hypothetical protein